MKKRLFASFLSLCVAMTLLPTAVFASASDKAIVPGASGITGYDAKNSYDYIYYGQYGQQQSPLKWRVLDDQTNTGGKGLFVLSELSLGTGSKGGIYFDDSTPWSKVWQGSTAQAWCTNFYTSNFTAGEQGAVLATTKSDAAYDSVSTVFKPTFAAAENILNGDKVFFLSAQEAETDSYGFVDDASRVTPYFDGTRINGNGLWWLRSPITGNSQNAGYVNGGGFTYDQWVGSQNSARPAFNLDVDSVLFSSAAVGGKVSQGTISPIAAYEGSEWKLTLLDQTRSTFAAETTAKTGNTLTVSYRNAATGADEYLSVLVADASGAYTHYGRILQLDGATHGASGTVDVALTDIDLTGKTVYLFNEQYNGGAQDDTKRTDYASPLIALSTADVYDLSVCSTQVTSDNASDVLGDGTVSYDPATHTLTLNHATLNPGANTTAISVGEFAQGFTIQLEGTNTIASTALAVDSASSLIIQGTQEGSLTAQGGMRLVQGATLRISPTRGTLMEVKVDADHADGSTAAHLQGSPYDTRVELDAQALQQLADCLYFRMGIHVHTGGTATCHDQAVCTDCGQPYGEVDPDNHVWEDSYTVDVAPTCTQEGSQSIHCQFCDATKDTQTVAALGHSFTHYESNHDATCTQNGTETAKCDRCDATDTREAADSALGHNATKVDAKAPTCTEPGNLAYWHCEVCGVYFADEALTEEITLEDTVLAPKGHGETQVVNAKEATCTAEGYTGDKVCKDCGTVLEQGKAIPKLDHHYENGVCTVCGAADPNASKPTPTPTPAPKPTQTPNPNQPQTGDASHVVVWMAALTLSGCLAAAMVLLRQRKRG